MKIFSSDNFDFFSPEISELEISYGGEVVAGFPSPADDFINEAIDLNKLMVKHPDATFYVKVKGNSMNGDFQDGDLLVIDKSAEWSDNRIALCFVINEFTLKRIKVEKDKCFLVPSNPEFPLIEVNPENNVIIWGVVTYAIKKL